MAKHLIDTDMRVIVEWYDYLETGDEVPHIVLRDTDKQKDITFTLAQFQRILAFGEMLLHPRF